MDDQIRKDWRLRAMRAIGGDTLLTMMKSCPSEDRLEVVRHVRSGYKPTRVSDRDLLDVCRRIVKVGNMDWVAHAATVLTDQAFDFCKSHLGDSYESPTRDEIDSLTPKLVEMFGSPTTMLTYACVLDSGGLASPILLEYFDADGQFALPEVVKTPDNTLQGATPDPKTRELRRARREQRRETKRKTASIPRGPRRPRRRQPLVVFEERQTADPTEDPSSLQTIEVARLHYPNISRFKGVQVDHDLRGSVVMAEVFYNKFDRSEGSKVRPCLVVGVTPKSFIVRPIFTKASGFAGRWRAVLVKDWEVAGLQHSSYVSNSVRKIPQRECSIVGSFSVNDWNRVCRGEVNTVGDE